MSAGSYLEPWQRVRSLAERMQPQVVTIVSDRGMWGVALVAEVCPGAVYWVGQWQHFSPQDMGMPESVRYCDDLPCALSDLYILDATEYGKDAVVRLVDRVLTDVARGGLLVVIR